MIKFQAENGEILIASNEVQAEAMKNGGLVEVQEAEEVAVEAPSIEEVTETVAPTTTKKGK